MVRGQITGDCVPAKERKKIQVFQLGLEGEPNIDGAVNHLSKFTILETASILKHSALHIDSEGGLVRIRRLLTTKPSAVLFGPTPVSLFGFENNINISANLCHPCFWMHPEWLHNCHLGWNKACMQGITAKAVWEKINESGALNAHRNNDNRK